MKINELQAFLTKLRKKKPLILNITNTVSAGLIADGLLALGASPVMISSPSEAKEMSALADAIVINMGTLNHDWIKLADLVCHENPNKIRVFDPVGVGATAYRTDFAQAFIMRHAFSVIRGNASEILALSGRSVKTQGVDALEQTGDLSETLHQLSLQTKAVIVASGKIDYIATQERIETCDYGSSLLPMLTGTGCLLTAVIAAFHTILEDAFESAYLATLYYGHVGALAAQTAKGPGSFKANFLDILAASSEIFYA